MNRNSLEDIGKRCGIVRLAADGGMQQEREYGAIEQQHGGAASGARSGRHAD